MYESAEAMPTFADLDRAVRSTLAGGRVGQPVFVRCHCPDPAGARDAVAEWIGSRPVREHALPSALVLGFANGASALVTEEARHDQPSPGIDLTVLGTRGGMYHSSLNSAPSWEKETTPANDPPRAKPQAAAYGVLLVSGAHTHQELYAPAFAADPRCRLVAVTDEAEVDHRRRDLNERFARSLGLPYLTDLGAALARDDVQVVSICAEPERRGRIIVRCAEAGKHLYLDKPLAPTLDGAAAVVAAVRKAGVRSHMFTFNTTPWARRAKQLLQSGRCGRLLAIHADTFFAKGHAGTAALRPRREQYPPGPHQLIEAKRELDNIGVYPVALVRWLTGQEFRGAYGITGNYFFAEHQRQDVEDFGLLAGSLEDGTPVTIACGRCGWASHPAGGANRVILVGSERTRVIDANRPRLEVSAAEPPWAPPPAHPDDPMAFWRSTQEEVAARPKRTWLPVGPAGPSDVCCFLDALDAGQDSEMNATEAAKVTEVLLAGYRSAATGQPVAVGPRSAAGRG